MADRSEDERLRALDDRIAALKAATAPPPRVDTHYSTANTAWRAAGVQTMLRTAAVLQREAEAKAAAAADDGREGDGRGD
ncbi:MAG: hypothetical protein MUF73_20220 [Rhodobacteraceae bacterium]|nr:hypothetical protein [Paracoccaceae bacterium]